MGWKCRPPDIETLPPCLCWRCRPPDIGSLRKAQVEADQKIARLEELLASARAQAEHFLRERELLRADVAHLERRLADRAGCCCIAKAAVVQAAFDRVLAVLEGAK